jgi:type IV secretory pathway TrbD component
MSRRVVLTILFLTLATDAMASMSGGSSRIPMTDFIVELYNVTNNVYVPMLAFGALVFGAANLLFGFMRFGPAIGRIFGVIGILGLGVTWFAQSHLVCPKCGGKRGAGVVLLGKESPMVDFSRDIPVPRGLVTDRLICGVPPWVFALLLVLGVAPLYLWGWGKWWVTLIALAIGWGLASFARDDPQFLSAWMSELRLKDYYE